MEERYLSYARCRCKTIFMTHVEGTEQVQIWVASTRGKEREGNGFRTVACRLRMHRVALSPCYSSMCLFNLLFIDMPVQAENAQLRRQAHLLLLRQQLLEEIADELGIKRSTR
eukprot:scaffold142649_cov25-Tisochrysis_lutea.AAC.2